MMIMFCYTGKLVSRHNRLISKIRGWFFGGAKMHRPDVGAWSECGSYYPALTYADALWDPNYLEACRELRRVSELPTASGRDLVAGAVENYAGGLLDKDVEEGERRARGALAMKCFACDVTDRLVISTCCRSTVLPEPSLR